MTHRLHKGRPKTADISTRAVLEAVLNCSRTEIVLTYEILMGRFACAEKVAVAAITREVNRGYLDYGTSLRFPWITPAGESYLKENTQCPS